MASRSRRRCWACTASHDPRTTRGRNSRRAPIEGMQRSAHFRCLSFMEPLSDLPRGRSHNPANGVCWCHLQLPGGLRMRLVPVLLVLALSAHQAIAQAPDSPRAPAGTTVSGIVHDSLARRPLADAMVQLVAPEGAPSFV